MLAAARADLRVEEIYTSPGKNGGCRLWTGGKKTGPGDGKGLTGLARPPKPDDAADALAVAICHAHSRLKYNPHACRMRE